ncbi:MAG: hypothetical protein QGH40_11570, partial [bacterium]|nr:hypothetical protein [bacterium]
HPKPFLYFYLLKLGYHIVYSSTVPRNDSQLMIIFDPPRSMASSFNNNLLPWVRKGGNLIVFLSKQHSIASKLGVDLKQPLPECEETPVNQLPYMEEVENTASSHASMNRRKGATFIPLMVNENGKSTALATFRGEGQIVLVTNAELFLPKGLKKEDNIVFVTRLVENLTVGKTIYLYSPDPEFTVKAKVRTRKGRSKPRPTKKKKEKYKSLWSLIKANPISWVLAQMLVGLAVYFYTLSRRFTRPVPVPKSGYSVDHYLTSMGRLYTRMQPTAFAAQRLLYTFLASFRKRLGLPAEEDDKQIFSRIESTHPHLVVNLRAAIRGLNSIITGEQKDSMRLIRYVRILEAARKELKIND